MDKHSIITSIIENMREGDNLLQAQLRIRQEFVDKLEEAIQDVKDSIEKGEL